MCRFRILYFINILSNLIKFIPAMSPQRHYLQSPCPNIFQYKYNSNSGDLYGLIEAQPPPKQNVIQLQIDMAIGNRIGNYNGHIELPHSKEVIISNILIGLPIQYIVYFPEWHRIPPQITKISINSNSICNGPKMQSNSWWQVITTVTLKHTLTINVASLEVRPPRPPPNNNNNNSQRPPQPPPDDILSQPSDYYDIDFKPIIGSNPFLRPPTTTTTTTATTTTTTTTTKTTSPLPPINSDILNRNPFLISLSTSAPRLDDITITTKKNPFFEKLPITTTTNPIKITSSRFTTSIPQSTTIIFNNKPQLDNRVNDDNCGLSISTNQLIVYGDTVPRGAFPWLVAIFDVNNTGLQYKCAGSLISKKHVITAAHCVIKNKRKLHPEEILLVLGKLNIKKWVLGDGEKQIEPYEIHIHPNYTPQSSDADIAIIILNEIIEFTKFIRPICLWMGNNDLNNVINKMGKIIGWGKDEYGDVMTAEPKQTTLPIVSQIECLRSNPSFGFITSNRTFCAGFRNGTGPCNGDSGSGFIIKENNRWYLRGVVSMSISNPESRTCDLTNYVVFTDASKYTDWILSFI